QSRPGMIAPFVWTLPWLLPLAAVIVRARRSHSLADAPDVLPPNAPHVSVVIPARNERRNIALCAARCDRRRRPLDRRHGRHGARDRTRRRAASRHRRPAAR